MHGQLAILTTIAVAMITVTGCQTATKTEGTKTPEVTKSSTNTEIEGTVVLKGDFEGKSDHKTSGKVTLEKTEKGYPGGPRRRF